MLLLLLLLHRHHSLLMLLCWHCSGRAFCARALCACRLLCCSAGAVCDGKVALCVRQRADGPGAAQRLLLLLLLLLLLAAQWLQHVTHNVRSMLSRSATFNASQSINSSLLGLLELQKSHQCGRLLLPGQRCPRLPLPQQLHPLLGRAREASRQRRHPGGSAGRRSRLRLLADGWPGEPLDVRHEQGRRRQGRAWGGASCVGASCIGANRAILRRARSLPQ